MCNCFTCQISKKKNMSEQYKLLLRAVFYATQITEYNSTLKLLYSLGYKSGHLTDKGIEGDIAAIECNRDDACILLSEIMDMLKPSYRSLVLAINPGAKIYKKDK